MKNNRGGYESTKKVEDLAPPPKGVAPGARKGSLAPDQSKRRPGNPHLKITRVERAPCPKLENGEVHRLVTREIPWKDGTFLETYCKACRRTSVRLDAELNDQYRTKPKDVGEA